MNASLPVPVVVVGNITAGGTGKITADRLAGPSLTEGSAGWQPVILSRGYGGNADHYPLLVNADTDARIAGDEPVMLALSNRDARLWWTRIADGVPYGHWSKGWVPFWCATTGSSIIGCPGILNWPFSMRPVGHRQRRPDSSGAVA